MFFDRKSHVVVHPCVLLRAVCQFLFEALKLLLIRIRCLLQTFDRHLQGADASIQPFSVPEHLGNAFWGDLDAQKLDQCLRQLRIAGEDRILDFRDQVIRREFSGMLPCNLFRIQDGMREFPVTAHDERTVPDI